jgi:hypothetical protein
LLLKKKQPTLREKAKAAGSSRGLYFKCRPLLDDNVVAANICPILELNSTDYF